MVRSNLALILLLTVTACHRKPPDLPSAPEPSSQPSPAAIVPPQMLDQAIAGAPPQTGDSQSQYLPTDGSPWPCRVLTPKSVIGLRQEISVRAYPSPLAPVVSWMYARSIRDVAACREFHIADAYHRWYRLEGRNSVYGSPQAEWVQANQVGDRNMSPTPTGDAQGTQDWKPFIPNISTSDSSVCPSEFVREPVTGYPMNNSAVVVRNPWHEDTGIPVEYVQMDVLAKLHRESRPTVRCAWTTNAKDFNGKPVTWYQVEVDDIKGWMASKDLTFDPSAVPEQQEWPQTDAYWFHQRFVSASWYPGYWEGQKISIQEFSNHEYMLLAARALNRDEPAHSAVVDLLFGYFETEPGNSTYAYAREHIYTREYFLKLLNAWPDHPDVLKRAPKAWVSDEEFLKKAVRASGLATQFAPAKLRDTKSFMVEAVYQNGDALEFASEKLRADHELVALAIDHGPDAYAFAEESVRRDKQLALKALSRTQSSAKIVDAMPPPLRDDAEVMNVAVRLDGLALRQASARLQDSDDLVREATTKTPKAMEFASARLKDSRDMAYSAIMSGGVAFLFLSDRLQGERELVLAALRRANLPCDTDGRVVDILHAASEEVLGDPEVMLIAIGEWPDALELASARLRGDREFVTKVVMSGRSGDAVQAFRFASEALRSDGVFVRQLVEKGANVAPFASERVRDSMGVEQGFVCPPCEAGC